jgi:hypothetical protein
MGTSSGLLMALCAALAIAAPLPGVDLAGEFAAIHGDEPGDVVREPFTAPDSGGITELAIQRTPCFGACPVYAFRVEADGRFQLDGKRFVKPEGPTTGSIDPAAFKQAAWRIAQGRFDDLHASYRIGATDMPGLYIKVVKDGKAKIVYSYGGAGPLELGAIASQIDKLAKLAGLIVKPDQP